LYAIVFNTAHARIITFGQSVGFYHNNVCATQKYEIIIITTGINFHKAEDNFQSPDSIFYDIAWLLLLSKGNSSDIEAVKLK